jgi:DNA-binding transcriptional regulator YdaS (Cro superfamily)
MTGLEKVIEHFGTAARLARAVGVTRQAVNSWKHRGVPLDKAVVIERVTGGKFTMRDICPDAFKAA